MLAFQVALGIVMAVAFLGTCYIAVENWAAIYAKCKAVLGPVLAPIWRNKIAILVVTAALVALTALSILRNEQRRAHGRVFNGYSNTSNFERSYPSVSGFQPIDSPPNKSVGCILKEIRTKKPSPAWLDDIVSNLDCSAQGGRPADRRH
jgi:hypothetical protein